MYSRISRVFYAVLIAATAGIAWSDDPAKTILKSQSFDRDPVWEGRRNRIVPKIIPTVTQSFGYSPTNFAGRASGEIGGRIHRAAEAAFYGLKIEPKTLDDRLSASGSFAFSKTEGNSGLFFGWFNGKQPGGTGRPVASLGMSFDCEPTGARLAVYVITAQNQVTGPFITRYERYRTPEERAIMRPTPIKNDGTRYHWKLDYDPATNEGNGRFRFTIQSDGAAKDEFEGKTFVADVPAGFKRQGTTFDHFGMMNLLKDGSSLTVHFDDLEVDGQAHDFSTDPGWDGSRNRDSYQAADVGGAHDFGFRTTDRAGGTPGELGGIAWRGPYAYYGDRVGALTLNDRLEARGRMFFEGAGLDAGLRIGWFNSELKEVDDRNPQYRNFVGVDIGGHTRVGHWFLPCCFTAKGDRHFNDMGNVLLKSGTTYEWSIEYDPEANAGNGRMRVVLGGKAATLDLKASAKVDGAVLDRFGLTTVGTGGGQVKLYLDDLKYTARPDGSAAVRGFRQAPPSATTTQ